MNHSFQTIVPFLFVLLIYILQEYKRVTSPPVHITPLDLGPKYADKLGSGVHEYCKTYGEAYCLGQLIFWHNQNAEPDAVLAKASRGCLSLPDVGSFYAKVQKPSRQRVYGPRTVKFMLSIMVSSACTFYVSSSFASLPKGEIQNLKLLKNLCKTHGF